MEEPNEHQEPVKDGAAEHPNMVLDARVFEAEDGFLIEIHLVYVP